MITSVSAVVLEQSISYNIMLYLLGSPVAFEHPQAEQYGTIFRMMVSFQPVEI